MEVRYIARVEHEESTSCHPPCAQVRRFAGHQRMLHDRRLHYGEYGAMSTPCVFLAF